MIFSNVDSLSDLRHLTHDENRPVGRNEIRQLRENFSFPPLVRDWVVIRHARGACPREGGERASRLVGSQKNILLFQANFSVPWTCLGSSVFPWLNFFTPSPLRGGGLRRELSRTVRVGGGKGHGG